jgi:ADP-heptose:LPS heptosyltransferase
MIPIRAVAFDDTRLLIRQRLRNGLPWVRPFNQVVRFAGKLHRAEKWRRLLEEVLGEPVTIDWPLRMLPTVTPPLQIFVHPHTGKARKQWPVDRFMASLQQVAKQMPIACRINEGTVAERSTTDQVERELRREGVATTRVPFDKNCVALRDALATSDVAVGADSGPMHLAAILGTPTVVIYGPYSPVEVAPLWRSTAVTPPPGSRSAGDVTPEAVSAAIVKTVSAEVSQANRHR